MTATRLIDVIKAAVAQAKLDAHPVGSLYWSREATDPAALFGGAWERVKDRFILAAGDIYAAGSEGGEATHTLTVDEIPPHVHQQNVTANEGLGTAGRADFRDDRGGYGIYDQGCTTLATGGGAAHNNMPPYATYYCWERIE